LRSPYITGSKVYLRPLERADLNETYLNWLNDPEVNLYLESGLFPVTMSQLNQFYDGLISKGGNIFFAIVEKSSNRHVGNIKLDQINWIHRTAVMGIMLGDKTVWGMGYGSEATKLSLKYAFGRINLNKVSLGVIADNERAVRIYERIGFVKEGVKRQEAFIDGDYRDALWMSILKKEFQTD